MLERSFSATGGLALLRRSVIRHWPPRYSDESTGVAAEPGAVSDSELLSDGGLKAPLKRTRVRSLLKPTVPRRARGAA